MPTVRYQVDEVPSSAWAEAFFPTAGITPAASSSISRFVSGYPGTARIASPRPAGAYTAFSSPEWSSPSAVAPDWFAPQLWLDEYTVHAHPAATPAGGGVSYMPKQLAQTVDPVVPQGGLGPLGPSQVAMTGRKVGGRRSMHWPRVLPRWPGLDGSYT